MARLIDDLLDVSRIVQGKVAVKPEKLQPGVADRALGRGQFAAPGRPRAGAGRGAARGARSSWKATRAPVAGAVEPDQQRLQVLARRQPHPAGRRTRRRRTADLGQGRGRRHRAGIPAAHVRPVRAGRPVAGPLAGRPGHRPHAGQAPGGAAWRPRVGRQRGLGKGAEVVVRLPAQVGHGAAPRRPGGRAATRGPAHMRLAHPGRGRPGGVGRDPDDAAGDGRLRGAGRARRPGGAERRRASSGPTWCCWTSGCQA